MPTSPSPICQVKDGAGAYASTTNGVNVTPGNTITINLVSAAGVSTWSIPCITTDELSVAAAVNASLTIDPVAKTATFTAPVAGRAYRFQSIVNGAIGPDGNYQPSYVTTFCIYTPTASSSRRVHATDETYESNATFGWVSDFNDLIRNPFANNYVVTPTGTGFVTTTGGVGDPTATASIRYTGGKLQTDANIQWKNATFTGDLSWTPTANRTLTLPDATDTVVCRATTDTLTNKTLTTPILVTPKILDSGSDNYYNLAVSDLAADRTITLPLLVANDVFVFESHTQTLTSKTLASPAVTGAITVSSFTSSTATTSDSKLKTTDAYVTAQTTDATQSSAYTSATLDDNAAHAIDVMVTAIKSDASAAACYKIHLAGRRASGTWTQLAAVVDNGTEETTAAWDATVDVSSSTFRVRVTGAASTTIRWGVAVRIQTTLP